MAAPTHRRINNYRIGILIAASCLWLVIIYPHIRSLFNERYDPAEAFHHNELRVGLDPSRPPFAFFAEDGSYLGLEVDLSYAIANVLELPVRLVPLGFDGLYDALTTDQVDIVIAGLQPVYHADGNAAAYSRHYFDDGLVLVSEAGYEDMADLAGRSLAYEFGSPADAEAQRWLRRIEPFTLYPYELPEYALDAVRLEEADAALVTATTARLYLQEHDLPTVTQEQMTHTWYTITVRSDRLDVLAIMNSILQRLDDNGMLEEITDEWL